MSKISEIVKVRSGYANYVQLRNALREDSENTERMAMYRPTKGHRSALERLSRGLFIPNDKKFYLLSGSYGTGKSHLCLMLANLLGKSGDDPSLKGFYDNYAKLDPTHAKQLKNIRQGGQFLVAVCEYGSGLRFEDAVLRAVVEACTERGIATEKQTEFDEAERLLTEWESLKGGVRNFYEDFTKALAAESPGTPVAALRAGLKKYDRPMMDKFHAAYVAAQGVPFQSKAGNLVAIVKKLVASREFTEKFKGLVIFFDEFGTAVLQGSKFDPAVMQAFMEEICQQQANVLFVGCIHKSFKDYSEKGAQATASVMSARLTQVDLLNEGIEEIIGAIVETDKESPEWKTQVLPKTSVFDQLTPPCLSLKLFPWIEDSTRIRERVLEDIYGMHPMALHCLLKLSSAVGSDVRSTFTFFSGGTIPDAGSYAEFIASSDITGSNGALKLYKTAQLFEFFAKELSPANRELFEMQRPMVNGYVSSLQELKKSQRDELFDEREDERVHLLRLMLIYFICGQATTLENLQFGSYCTSASEKTAIKKQLDQLVAAGAIYLKKSSNTYELCAAEGQDPYTLLDAMANSEAIEAKATVEELLRQTGSLEEYIPANGYNVPFGEDKRLKRVFVRGRELGPDLWKTLESAAATAGAKFPTAYEGCAVTAICEDDAEIALARSALKSIPAGTILVAVPHESSPFREDLKLLLACRHFLAPDEATKLPAQTTARITDIQGGGEDGVLTKLRKLVTSVANGLQATWYEEGGKLLLEKPTQPHQPADALCGRLFAERSQINHPDLNVIHDEKWVKSASLKQAVNELLEFSTTIQIDNGSAENHGEKRYLQKVLLACGALHPLAGGSGTVKEFEAESDPAKLSDKFPVLKKLLTRLTNLKPADSLALSSFAKDMREAPVGAGGTMLVLAVAHAVRAFGEQLRIFSDSTRAERGDLGSFESIVAAINDRSSKIELAVVKITEPQRQLVEALAKAVDAPALASGEVRSVKSAHTAVRDWWNKLPAISKVVKIYPTANQARLESLKQTLGDGLIEAFDLMLMRLPSVYADGPVDTITEDEVKQWTADFNADVMLLNGGLDVVKRKLAGALLAHHGKKGDLVAAEKEVGAWFQGLTPDQRNATRCEDEDAQHLLQVLNDGAKPFEVKLLQSLPQKWGFGAVTQWTSLQIDAYSAKWELAKKAIEEVKPLMDEPVVAPDELTTTVNAKVWEVEDGAKINIQFPEGAESVEWSLGDEKGTATFESATLKEAGTIPVDLKGKASGTLKVIAMDPSGNRSRVVEIFLRHKQKQHEVTVEQEDLLGEKGMFKFPDSVTSFIAVIQSLSRQAFERKIISVEALEQMKATLTQLKKD